MLRGYNLTEYADMFINFSMKAMSFSHQKIPLVLYSSIYKFLLVVVGRVVSNVVVGFLFFVVLLVVTGLVVVAGFGAGDL